MSDLTYDKAHFEQDLRALGAVPQGGPDVLPELMRDHDLAVVTGVVGGVSLLGMRADYEFPDVVKGSFNRLPASYAYTDGVLVSKIGDTPVTAYNPFAVSVYFPDGNNGQGEAAHYTLDEPIIEDVEEQRRTITEQEAVGRLVRGAHVVDAKLGLFIPRVELERLYALSLSKGHRDLTVINERGFQDFVRTQLPTIRVSVDPYHMNGDLQLEEPISHGGVIINSVSFVGTSPVTLHGRIYRHDAESEKIEQLSLAPDAQARFTTENRLHFNGKMANRKAWHVNDFLTMPPQATGKWGQPLPLRLEGGMGLPEAVRRGILPEGLVRTPVSATKILYDALTADRDSKYLRQLRTELRPQAVIHDFVDAVRHTAIQQWQEVFRGERSVDPRIVGLRAVAARARILRA